MKLFTFKAEAHCDRWMPLGRNEKGDEVWCDGCCVESKLLAERIAANMEAAYRQGVEDGARQMVQAAIKVTKAVGGSISDSTIVGSRGWLINEDTSDG